MPEISWYRELRQFMFTYIINTIYFLVQVIKYWIHETPGKWEHDPPESRN